MVMKLKYAKFKKLVLNHTTMELGNRLNGMMVLYFI